MHKQIQNWSGIVMECNGLLNQFHLLLPSLGLVRSFRFGSLSACKKETFGFCVCDYYCCCAIDGIWNILLFVLLPEVFQFSYSVRVLFRLPICYSIWQIRDRSRKMSALKIKTKISENNKSFSLHTQTNGMFGGNSYCGRYFLFALICVHINK